MFGLEQNREKESREWKEPMSEPLAEIYMHVSVKAVTKAENFRMNFPSYYNNATCIWKSTVEKNEIPANLTGRFFFVWPCFPITTFLEKCVFIFNQFIPYFGWQCLNTEQVRLNHLLSVLCDCRICLSYLMSDVWMFLGHDNKHIFSQFTHFSAMNY